MAIGDFTRINTNIGALNALNSLKSVQTKLGVSQLRLATGKQINSAADDPAGLTIATKFQYRASGLGQALSNIGDAKNMMAVAEGGLQKINDILIKMRDKATQAASDTLGSDERTAIKNQLAQFSDEIDAIVDSTKWNGNKLLDGLASFSSNQVIFQTGADNESASQITLSSSNFGDCSTDQLGINSLDVTSAASAGAAMDSLGSAIKDVSTKLQTVGALVSRLDFREETVTVAKVNTEAAYSRIMDADMANEQLNATKYQILQQTATAMLAQANQTPQGILSLFR
ncbi:MAG: flagellin [Dehalococcoidales bacterium]|nr:flagellin [Dehalococcoidales bacterium]